jgi:hypothetical protein
MNVLSSSIASVFLGTGNGGGDRGDEDDSSIPPVFLRLVLGFFFAMLVKCCYGMK